MSSEVSISIFILKTRTDSHRNVETFLKNRKWKVESATSIRDALTYIFQNKPDVVMVPSDHPNKKVRSLPKMLLETFSIQVITYCDSEAKSSIASLQEMGTEYILFPPISGPSIERLVLKAKKKGANSGSIHLKGSQTPPPLDQLIAMIGDDESPGTFVDKGEKVKSSRASEGSALAEMKSNVQKGNKGALIEYQPAPKLDSPRLASPAHAQALDQISQSVGRAMQESLGGLKPEANYEAVAEISKCSCLRVKSDLVSGYLLAALGQSRLMHLDCAQNFKQKINSALQAEHPDLQVDEKTLELEFSQVGFEKWALSDADFIKKAVVGKTEMVLAFFPSEKAAHELSEGPTAEMLAFEVPELKASLKVPCNLYIHLPENGKYLLYLTKGRTLTLEQQSRLLKNGISLMYLAKEEKIWAQQYRAENELNEKIESFHSLEQQIRSV